MGKGSILSDLRMVAEAGGTPCGRANPRRRQAVRSNAGKCILDRRAIYEGHYKYAGVEADGQHRAIL
jgi:hypothetical protein